MKSKKNLTRFTYVTTDFQGWRLSIARAGIVFVKYYSDKKYGGVRKAYHAADTVLNEVKDILDSSRRYKGKLSKTTIDKVNKIMEA